MNTPAVTIQYEKFNPLTGDWEKVGEPDVVEFNTQEECLSSFNDLKDSEKDDVIVVSDESYLLYLCNGRGRERYTLA